MTLTVKMRCVYVALIGLLLTPLLPAKDVALVAGKGSLLKGVAAADVAKAMKSSALKWPDGKEIVFVVKAAGTSETRVLGTKLLAQTPETLPAYLSGQKKNFIVVNTDFEVMAAVNANPNAIGAVDIYSINSSVVVLKVDGKLPLEPGYLLHYN